MSGAAKLIERLKSKPKDFTWREATALLAHFGFVELPGRGSRRKFHNPGGPKDVFITHEPHPRSEMDPGATKDLLTFLTKNGYIKEEDDG